MLVTVTFLDGQFGLLSDAPRACVTIGSASAGPLNQLTSITSKQALLDTFTAGPLVEADAFQLANGTGTGYAMRCGTTTPGVISTVTATLKAGSDAVLAVTGTTVDGFRSILVRINSGGNVAGPTSPTAQISWDGGINYEPEFTIPIGGVYVPTNPVSGLTFTFTGATIKTGDAFSLNVTAPVFGSADVVTVLEALRIDETSDWEFFHLVGPCSATIATAVQTELNLMKADGRFAWALVEARDQNTGETEAAWMTSLKADYLNFVAPQGQVVVVAGYGYLLSAVSGRTYWRPLATTVAAHVTNTPTYTDHLGATSLGALPGIVTGPDGRTYVSHDERKVPGLAQARFLTIATIVGKRGFFVGDPATYSPATMAQSLSDYRKLMFTRVAMRTANLAMIIGTNLLGEKVETNRNGTINGRFAKETENLMRAQLRNYLVPRDLIDIDVEIDRNENMKVTSRVPVTLLMNSYAYAEKVAFTLGFLNPNLVAVT